MSQKARSLLKRLKKISGPVYYIEDLDEIEREIYGETESEEENGTDSNSERDDD